MKFASPRYPAVMECVPSARDEVVNVAWPLISTLVEPSREAPSLN